MRYTLKTYAVGLMLAVTLSILYLSFSSGRPVDKVHTRSMQNLSELKEGSKRLKQAAINFQEHTVELPELQNALVQLRETYKRYEFLYAYFYPRYVKSKINGAPLPHLDPFYARPSVLPPNGLQRLDELIFSDEVLENPSAVVELSRKFEKDLRPILENMKVHPMIDREIFEATRFQIIRIFTLGVSGFDTPGSLNGLQESRVSLEELKFVMLAYASQLASGNSELEEELKATFSKGVQQLAEAKSFEEFDRLHFLVDVVNPLLKQTLNLQLALGIETIDEVTSLPQSVNYQSTNLFANNFLNPYFYSSLPASEDSEEKRQLGKKLFFDKNLSASGKLSCGSCHNPQLAFTDGEVTSVANNGKDRLQRNSPTLVNSIYATRFFSDMRARKFSDQMEHVVSDHKEFDTDFISILNKLESDSIYSKEFSKVFGRSGISKNNFSEALISYLISLRGFNSEFDAYVRKEQAHLDPKIKNGFNLFMGKAACGTCHFPPTFAGLVPPHFNDSESEVLGVLDQPLGDLDQDRGRFNNGLPKEEGVCFYEFSFKTPTVRNVAITAPYFHNGAYPALEDVVDFYDHGGAVGLGIELPHQTLAGDSLHLSSEEKEALQAFMESLTNKNSKK